MGVYSMQSINESTNYLDDVEFVDNGIEDVMESALHNIYESDQNLHNMMKGIGVAELAVYEQTGEDIVYEAGTASSVFARIKAGLKKIWEKIKSLFTKFFAKLRSYGKDDKAFVSKYNKQILAGSTKDLKVKGFKFDTDAVTPKSAWDNMKSKNNVFSTYLTGLKTTDPSNNKFMPIDHDKEEKAAFGESESDFNDKLRASALGESGEMSASEFQKELYEKFRSGESKPETLEDNDIKKGEMIQFLSNSSKTEKDLNTDMKNIKTTIEELIKLVEKHDKHYGKVQSGETDADITKRGINLSFYTRMNTHLNAALGICQTVAAARMKAFNDKRGLYKSICVKLIGRKSKNEGYEFGDEQDYQSYGESALDAIFANTKLI